MVEGRSSREGWITSTWLKVESRNAHLEVERSEVERSGTDGWSQESGRNVYVIQLGWWSTITACSVKFCSSSDLSTSICCQNGHPDFDLRPAITSFEQTLDTDRSSPTSRALASQLPIGPDSSPALRPSIPNSRPQPSAAGCRRRG